MPDLSSVLEEWRQLLGDEFGITRPLLRPTPHRADVFPCPSPGGNGCPRRVVELGGKGLYAVCGDVERGCRDIPLKPEEVIVYELDRRKLGLLAVMALGATPITFAPVASMREMYRVGEHRPWAGDRFPVFLSIQPDHERLRDVASRLCRTEPNPFILLIPTDLFVTPDLRQMLAERKSRLFSLGEILAFDEAGGNLVPTHNAAELLAAFHAEVLPDAEVRNRFPTPPDARWNEIKIRFQNRDTVTIQCQGTVRTATYHEVGMADGRSGQPNKQWMLLYEMADDRGRMDIRSPHVSRLNKKRKELLSKSLQGYFGLADDPILWDEEASAYIARFTLEPES